MDTKLRELIEKDERYVWHALSRYTPVEGGGTAPVPRLMVAEGSGAWVSDAEGNRYLDGMSGLWCVNVGYGREELARAAYDQLVKLPYYPLTMSHEPAVRLGGQRDGLQGRAPVPRAERRAGPLEVRISLPGLPRQLHGLVGRHGSGPAQVPLRAAGFRVPARRSPRPLPLRLLRRSPRVQPGVRPLHRAHHPVGAAR